MGPHKTLYDTIIKRKGGNNLTGDMSLEEIEDIQAEIVSPGTTVVHVGKIKINKNEVEGIIITEEKDE